MNEKLRHLDLFSGIGGFALGLESTGGFETVGFCDNEPFAQKVLKKHWPDVPCYEDVRDVGVDTVGYRGVDIITGGFPCQPYSVAGKQDPKDNRQLWPEMFRIIKEIRPTYVIGENVRNLISIREGVVFEQVCTDLESEGYEVQTYVLSASSQNAPHLRYRCWIVGIMADTESQRSFSTSKRRKRKQEQSGILNDKKEVRSEVWSKSARCSELREQNVANSNSHERQHLCRQKSEQTQKTQQRSGKRGGSQKQDVADTKIKGLQGRLINSTIKKEEPRTGNARTESANAESDVSNSISQRGRSRKSRGKDAEDARKLSRSEEHRQGNTIGRMGGTTDGLSKGLDRHWGDGWEEGTPRVAEGQKNRANRLKGLGNAVVPQIPAVLGRAILEVHNG